MALLGDPGYPGPDDDGWITDLRAVLLVTPDAETAQRHIAAMIAAAPAAAAASSNVVSLRGHRSRRAIAAVSLAGAVLVGGAGLAAAGELPAPLQHAVAHVVRPLGIHLDDPDADGQGSSDQAPGHTGDTGRPADPGKSADAPGQTGDNPGRSDTSPGHSDATNNKPATNPGHDGQSEADKAKADKAQADKAQADKAQADKAAADKVAADKATADKAQADKAAADKAAAEKANSGGGSVTPKATSPTSPTTKKATTSKG